MAVANRGSGALRTIASQIDVWHSNAREGEVTKFSYFKQNGSHASKLGSIEHVKEQLREQRVGNWNKLGRGTLRGIR